MKITIEPEKGEKIEDKNGKELEKPPPPIVYEHVCEFCLVGMRTDQLGMVPVRRLHTNQKQPFRLIGMVGGVHQELFAEALLSQGFPHRHDVDEVVAEQTPKED